MGDINSFALPQAEAAAAKLWALGSSAFPLATSTAAIIQRHIDWLVTDTAIDFAIHVRRILDIGAIRTEFTLNEQFRHLSEHRLPRVTDLQEALNGIVHATEFEIGFLPLPANAAGIGGGARGDLSANQNGSTRGSRHRCIFVGLVLLSPSLTRAAYAWQAVHT